MGFSTQTPMLNMAPKGFVPGRITKSFLMCPGNLEYYLADKIIPFFHAAGFSPNHVTLLNCFWVRIPSIYLFLQGDYVMFVFLLLMQQVLDCADGQLARKFRWSSSLVIPLTPSHKHIALHVKSLRRAK